jgi:hypothetical protein
MLPETMNIEEHLKKSFDLLISQTILMFCAVGAWAEDLVAQEQYR